jgi:2-octaprenyl-6-methoxyphenol hydroxylase
LAHSGLRIAVVEARSEPANDARALALAHASREVLAPLGIWPDEATAAIHTVHVSQQYGFGRVVLDREELRLPALGYVMPYAALALAIHAQLATTSTIHYLTGARVTEVSRLASYACATIEQAGVAHTITAGLLVLAEGGRLLGAAGVDQGMRDYAQQALVTEVVADRPHANRAFERFAADGPIALLPLPGSRGSPKGHYAVVWTRPTSDPLNAVGLSDERFLAELQRRIGERAGLFEQVGARSVFPLTLKWAQQHQAQRLAVVGNAAQTLHPVAGQGFNLGLRDAMALARLVRATPREQLGDAAMLARYEKLRQIDSLATIGFTDGLIRLFGQDQQQIKAMRGLGLFAMGNCKPLRRGFAQRMVFGTP